MTSQLPRIASLTPFKIEAKKDESYSWCTCGYSKKEPFCDGSHKEFKNPDGSSIMKSMKFSVESDKTVFLCGCKNSKNPPFCDGSHAKISK